MESLEGTARVCALKVGYLYESPPSLYPQPNPTQLNSTQLNHDHNHDHDHDHNHDHNHKHNHKPNPNCYPIIPATGRTPATTLTLTLTLTLTVTPHILSPPPNGLAARRNNSRTRTHSHYHSLTHSLTHPNPAPQPRCAQL